jgi:uncharacterized protein (TIGR02996 family)
MHPRAEVTNMDHAEAFLGAMVEKPNDLGLRLIFADWLEEHGDPRGELLRLTHLLTHSIDVPDRSEKEARLQALQASGVRAIGPFLTNDLGMEFAWIPPGVVQMGSSEMERSRAHDEVLHRVTFTQGFWMQATLLTQRQWKAIMKGRNPSRFQGEDLPVESVSWGQAMDFCKALNKKEKKGWEYRLPSEAEWEYAARAGTQTPFWQGKTIRTDQVNCDGCISYLPAGATGDSRRMTTPVRQFTANAFGLHDMGGNVWQWCQDWYGPYPGGDVTDPEPGEEGERHVLRGGSCLNFPSGCRLALRNSGISGSGYDLCGFRVVAVGGLL